MGFTTVKVDIANATTPSRRGEVEVLVDTGALYTMVPRRILAELGVEPRRKIEFELANGTRMVRDVGEARFYFNGDDAVSRVIFG